MLFALDYHDNRVHIDETHSNQEYFCPSCGEPLIARKGEQRIHHFAHKSLSQCRDSWVTDNSYEMSGWHNDWQSRFPKNNQEIKLALGDTVHRADVLVDRTVVEFQHSGMSQQAFDNRNNFYDNLGYRVVWLFDVVELKNKGALSYEPCEGGLKWKWNNPKKAFNSYDIKTGNIDLYFQISFADEQSIVKVTDVSEGGYEEFSTTPLMNPTEFLSQVGLENGHCLPPLLLSDVNNEDYQKFKEEYHISLNPQQERALLAINGSNLLLAVPGSGKTTVLVDRIGYMILVKKIKPESILAITFNTSAVAEIKKRLSAKFGKCQTDKVDVRTINSLSLEIYKKSCKLKNKKTRELIDKHCQRKEIINIYKEYHEEEYPSEAEILDMIGAFGYVKNMMKKNEAVQQYSSEDNSFPEMYRKYQDYLSKNNLMDYDDQMVFAFAALQKIPEILNHYRSKYNYICVDEAQDTSKIQHEIIKLLAKANNLFMVGDEDQSIYGFRGAFPKAFLNFRCDYQNPYILKLETNYRSTTKIVEKSRQFIEHGKGRYKKEMVSARETGEPVSLVKVKNRMEQFERIVDEAANRRSEMAVLYRDNESSVVLVDKCLRKQIPFVLKCPEMNFLEIKVVRDIISYLKLSKNNKDYESFRYICNRGILYLKQKQKDFAIKDMREKGYNVFQAIEKQMPLLPKKDRDRGEKFQEYMDYISDTDSPYEAIERIIQCGYESILEKSKSDFDRIMLLKMIAKEETTISGFLERLNIVNNAMKSAATSSGNNPVILSTIHSSKGLEYDTVWLIDVYDGRLPSQLSYSSNKSKDNMNSEQEERRLFYVGMTRAKNKLNIIEIAGFKSTFIDEVFWQEKNTEQQKKKQIDLEKEHFIRAQSHVVVNPQKIKWGETGYYQSQPAPKKETTNPIAVFNNKQSGFRSSLEEEKALRDKMAELFTQNETEILDPMGNRWIKCQYCGEVKRKEEFVEYGGQHRINTGTCNDCSKKGY